ncbi:MAG: YbgC/FadM family acyl-CoA thioesterase [Woeseiaceae bacterium]|jgi:acyl-CoA thioester hydrolase
MPAPPFEFPVRVYYEDTDAQGVVYYANYFRFMERARTEWLRSLGVDMVHLQEHDRRIFVVVEVNVRFHAPARLNDDLVVTAGLVDRTRTWFDIEQKIFRNSTDGQLLISGIVKAAYLDADSMRPTRLPSIFEEETS